MQFRQVDDDAYDVRMNLDSIKRISQGMTYLGSDNPVDDSRNQAIALGFQSAYNKFSEEEVAEVSDEQ